MKPANHAVRSKYPGTEGSSFDVLVRLGDLVESIPAPIFAVILFLLALVPARIDLPRALVLLAFMLGDWLILGLLPHAGESYGPAQPPTLLLAGMRCVPSAFLPLPWNLVPQLIGTGLVVYGFWIEPHTIRLTQETLDSPKLKAGPPLRVLHLGDLHVERVTEREEQLLEMVDSIGADLILYSGDFLNLSYVDDPVAWSHARAILRELHAPMGVFAVSGSPPVDKPQVVVPLLDGLGIRWLRNEQVTLHHAGQAIDIIGLNCTHVPSIDELQLRKLRRQRSDNFTILLYHTPDLAPQAAEAGIDLQLSGHTHGGQVRLPFFGALFTSSIYGKQFEVGRRQIGDFTLYVTRGIGMEGKGAPRVRFLCPPEITLWEISGTKRS